MMRRLLRAGPVIGDANRQDSCAKKNYLMQGFKHRITTDPCLNAPGSFM
jgi:hypothetical protein